MTFDLDPLSLLRPRRSIEGNSAILLPWQANGEVDWSAFRAHLLRTVEAGLIPAINMDTGFAHLISDELRREVLAVTQATLGRGRFLAGAFVGDRPGDSFAYDAYAQQIEQITHFGGTPVIFQSYGLTQLTDDALIDAYTRLGRLCDQMIGFELGTMFAPFGKIYSLDVYREWLGIRSLIGAKHSSLNRQLEWERLRLRDQIRPDFRVYTGNDLAIDMVMYGSDYLLGLSTFAPDLFAQRDRYWAQGHPGFYQLNDGLQYLGFFAFRPPVPAYKHSAAMFLKLRGWISCDQTHPRSAQRPESDRPVLREIARLLEIPVSK